MENMEDYSSTHKQNGIMKRIIRFYAICCLGNFIYHYIVDYILVLYGDTDLNYRE